MGHVRFGFVAAAGLLAVLSIGRSANAADQGITGKKLLLKSNPKLVLLSKDALVVPGANGRPADPRCAPDGGGLGGSVKLDDGTNSVTLSMPCANWSANGAGTLYKYKDAAGTPKVGKVKAGLLKVVSPAGMGGFPVPNGAASVDVEVTVGTDKYCMSFSGTGDGSKFLVKDATAGSCPPTPTPTATATATATAPPTATLSACTGQLVGGFCWFLGASGDSCDATCTGMGLVCDPATVSYAGSGGTDAQCLSVLTALGVTETFNASYTCNDPVGCIKNTDLMGSYHCIDPPTTCDGSAGNNFRACACQ